jgi:membrane protein required for colicin V production
VDWILVVTLLVSILIGVLRGFTREILGLATWIAALIGALVLAPHVVPMLEHQVSVPSLRIPAAYALVFLAFMVVGSVITYIVASVVRKSLLSGVDRMVGGGFGAMRGVLMAVMMVWLVGMTPARQDPWWKESLFVGKLQWLAQGFDKAMPSDWAQRLQPPVAVKEGV